MQRRFLILPAAAAVGLAAEWSGYGWGDSGHWIPDLAVGWCLIGCGFIASASAPREPLGCPDVGHGFRLVPRELRRSRRGRRGVGGCSCSLPAPRAGYLLKERVFDMATVVDALRRIVDGETVIDPTIVARLLGLVLPGRSAGRAHRPGTRSPGARGRRDVEPRDRRPAVRDRAHRRGARHADPAQARPSRITQTSIVACSPC